MKTITALAGFIILFFLYHAAEYMIMFKNSPVGFLAFQFLFLIAAWGIAKWQGRPGLKAWGLDTQRGFLIHLVVGLLMGCLLYGITFLIGCLAGIERLVEIPTFATIAMPLGLFVFGNFFSSLSEDILTRGYVFAHLRGKVGTSFLAFISATIYLLNHIYRLGDGFQAYLYLFLLGVLFIIPLLRTNRLWFTVGMHWAGNVTFYLVHELWRTEDTGHVLSANYVLAAVILLFIPLNNFVLKLLRVRGQV